MSLRSIFITRFMAGEIWNTDFHEETSDRAGRMVMYILLEFRTRPSRNGSSVSGHPFSVYTQNTGPARLGAKSISVRWIPGLRGVRPPNAFNRCACAYIS